MGSASKQRLLGDHDGTLEGSESEGSVANVQKLHNTRQALAETTNLSESTRSIDSAISTSSFSSLIRTIYAPSSSSDIVDPVIPSIESLGYDLPSVAQVEAERKELVVGQEAQQGVYLMEERRMVVKIGSWVRASEGEAIEFVRRTFGGAVPVPKVITSESRASDLEMLEETLKQQSLDEKKSMQHQQSKPAGLLLGYRQNVKEKGFYELCTMLYNSKDSFTIYFLDKNYKPHASTDVARMRSSWNDETWIKHPLDTLDIDLLEKIRSVIFSWSKTGPVETDGKDFVRDVVVQLQREVDGFRGYEALMKALKAHD
ncbi:hypothetical protein MNV49_006565 [Pseudohyphozyma bogoriensis]|nr:hypothetical protein MNV49_006565 [Pseudohyphozyma bogoriensis]